MLSQVEQALQRGEYPLDLLNALTTAGLEWRLTRAAKGHVDEFGERISMGDHYFNRHLAGTFSGNRKVSQKSMERLLEVVFAGNGLGVQLATQLIRQQDAEMVAAAAILDRRDTRASAEAAERPGRD